MIGAVILAAGASQRMGRPKQLLPVDGVPMLVRVVATAAAAGVDEIIVVLGASAEAIRPVLAGQPVTVVVNQRWEKGLASSIRTGLAAVSDDTEAVFFVPCDLPRLRAETMRMLATHFQVTGKGIIIPTYRGQRGNPVLFARPLFKHLLALQGDEGGRVLFARFPAEVTFIETDDKGILLDIDTPKDYRRLAALPHLQGLL